MERSLDVFVSYKHEDRARAESLVRMLEAQDWQVWWDRHLEVGKRFGEDLERHIKLAKCVVVLWSMASAKSDWVLSEAIDGLKREILAPARLDKVQPPKPFGVLQTADLSEWNGELDHPELQKLLRSVECILAGTPQDAPGLGTWRPTHLRRWLVAAVLILALVAVLVFVQLFTGPAPVIVNSGEPPELARLADSTGVFQFQYPDAFEGLRQFEESSWLHSEQAFGFIMGNLPRDLWSFVLSKGKVRGMVVEVSPAPKIMTDEEWVYLCEVMLPILAPGKDADVTLLVENEVISVENVPEKHRLYLETRAKVPFGSLFQIHLLQETDGVLLYAHAVVNDKDTWAEIRDGIRTSFQTLKWSPSAARQALHIKVDPGEYNVKLPEDLGVPDSEEALETLALTLMEQGYSVERIEGGEYIGSGPWSVIAVGDLVPLEVAVPVLRFIERELPIRYVALLDLESSRDSLWLLPQAYAEQKGLNEVSSADYRRLSREDWNSMSDFHDSVLGFAVRD